MRARLDLTGNPAQKFYADKPGATDAILRAPTKVNESTRPL